MLNKTFSEWPSTSAPILHPAASLLPVQPTVDTSSTSISQSDQPGSPLKANESSQLDEASSSASPNTTTAALALSSRFQREGDASREFDSTIKDADLQAFYPSKKRAPAEWGGSWGRRLDSQAAIDGEKRTIFSMLDDFEGQPPFTIQRLSELILRPSEHHHTLAKYVSALKRLLAVTATRDAFPAHGAEEEVEQESFMVSVPGVNGHATPGSTTSRSRTGTPVPGSPNTAPLFSPIPFLKKPGDEGMPGEGDQEDSLMIDEDVPGMELGGADRTSESAVEFAKQSGAGAGSGSRLGSGVSSGRSSEGAGGVGSARNSESTADMSKVIVTHSAAEPMPVVNSSEVTNAGNGPSSNEPLGVPSGYVDEFDTIGQKHGKLPPVDISTLGGGAKALSATTTSSKASTESLSDLEKESATKEEESIRAIKRIRSERDLTDGKGEREA
ncbi:hypothetical protein CBS101457_000604 [Exobasidium rhododendri]|nr:hypothetical protein CBS101457_000604 [Exobasidium rhododendri]